MKLTTIDGPAARNAVQAPLSIQTSKRADCGADDGIIIADEEATWDRPTRV